MRTSVSSTTDSEAFALKSSSVAARELLPVATPDARPAVLTVAMLVSLLVQLAWLVTSSRVCATGSTRKA
ncbi:hypothetical protein A3767_22365 [Oleiphilus sp. HI0133]|nr:hypothetical protein A3767_22365 [Oleiphilus sp. HI0133]